MESSLSEAFQGVFSSSKEIVRNHQSQLYCNMLELLRNTCKTAGLSTSKVNQEELAKFWLIDILPMVFSENEKLQKNAIDALEQYLSVFDISAWHSYEFWPEVRNTILNTYAADLHKLRNAQSNYWHKIWCLMVRLLNREILKGANAINTFLAIVEQGFRNNASKVRNESFSCWHLLIHIFHTHGELMAPKRMKLVCIPLKTASSKNMQLKSIVVKLHVWWYLLICLGDKLQEFMPNVVKPFIEFCLNAMSQCTNNFDIPLLCLTALVSENINKDLLEQRDLECLTAPAPLLHKNILTEHAEFIINNVLNAIKLTVDNPNLDGELKVSMLQKLIEFLHTAMFHCPQYLNHVCDELYNLLCSNRNLYEFSLNNLIERKTTFVEALLKETTTENAWRLLVHYCIKAKAIVDAKFIDNMLQNMLKLEDAHKKQIGSILNDLLQVFNELKDSDIDIKFKIWQRIAFEIPEDQRAQTIVVVAKEQTNHVFNWILWPIEILCENQQNITEAICNTTFTATWIRLFEATKTCIGFTKFLNNLGNVLTKSLMANGNNTECFIKMFQSYNTAVMDVVYDKGLTNRRELLTHLNTIVSDSNVEKSVLEMSLKCTTTIIMNLKHHEMTAMFDEIKKTLTTITQNLKKYKCDAAVVDHWKRVILEQLRTHPDKQKFAQIKELLKGDVFVIIPNVWSLNPEKLTDRQKERYAEKSDTSALYNENLSATPQQSPIKAWTPKKVVIGRIDQAEITLEGCDSNDSIEIVDAEPSEMIETPSLDLTILANLEKNEVTTTTPSTSEAKADMHSSRKKDITCRESSPPAAFKSTSGSEEAVQNKCSERLQEANVSRPIMLDIIAQNETSPKKNLANFVLSSPPDRKSTNNSRSPTLRPKSTGHMTGRGAQLINMIRNRSVDSSSALQQTTAAATAKDDKIEFSSPSAREQPTHSTPTTDMLIFSKRLPSPSASPSVSILKRRIRQRVMDDSDLQDLPASKRKRVSFHDPPVSVTKQYVREDGEIKSRPKRCLIMDKSITMSTPEQKVIMRRRNSCTEVDRLLSNAGDKRSTDNIFMPPKHLGFNNSANAIMPIRHAITSSQEVKNNTSMTPIEALNMAVEQLPLDVILQKCLVGKPMPLRSIHTFTKVVSQCMKQDANVKTKTLEKLSEDHSKEILDFALQENLSSVVCDRLNFNSVSEFICQKLKINAGCRNTIIAQLKDVLKPNELFDSFDFVRQILEDRAFTDSQILDLLTIMTQKRHLVQTTEKAPDSSTNL